jgi:hypothetical protein
MEKYESKAAHCVKEAQHAPDKAGQAFYDELAHYYGELAKDFRRVLAKRERLRRSLPISTSGPNEKPADVRPGTTYFDRPRQAQ